MKELINILKGKRKLLFFDLEGTQETKEIIAIGASKVNLDAKFFIKNFDKKGFKQYVKSNGEIGKFVTDLTNINEKTLKEKGITFEKMIDKFKSYVGKNPGDFLFITYGNFDLKLLHTTCQLHNDYGRNFIDIICKNYLDLSNFSSRFVKDNNFNKCSLVESIVNLDGTPLKNEHDPLVDTKMFDKTFCGLRRVHINPATHPAPMRPLYGLAGGNVIPAPAHTGIKPASVNVAVNRLPDNARSLF